MKNEIFEKNDFPAIFKGNLYDSKNDFPDVLGSSKFQDVLRNVWTKFPEILSFLAHPEGAFWASASDPYSDVAVYRGKSSNLKKSPMGLYRFFSC